MPKGIPKNGINKSWFKKGNKGYWLDKNRSEETKRKLSKYHKGKKLSEKTRIKISKKIKKKWQKSEYKKKQIKSHKGRPSGMLNKTHSIEARKKNGKIIVNDLMAKYGK